MALGRQHPNARRRCTSALDARTATRCRRPSNLPTFHSHRPLQLSSSAGSAFASVGFVLSARQSTYRCRRSTSRSSPEESLEFLHGPAAEDQLPVCVGCHRANPGKHRMYTLHCRHGIRRQPSLSSDICSSPIPYPVHPKPSPSSQIDQHSLEPSGPDSTCLARLGTQRAPKSQHHACTRNTYVCSTRPRKGSASPSVSVVRSCRGISTSRTGTCILCQSIA